MIIISDDVGQIAHLKMQLGKNFEIKDLERLQYFLGIKVSKGPGEILLSQMKYVLDLLKVTWC
jgi:Reverse transcriptase (RNA-dependent DNA polymerase)